MSKDLAMQENELQAVQWDMHPIEEQKPLEFTEENSINAVGIPLTVQENALKGLMVHLAERDLLDKEFEYLSKQEVTPENIKQFKELRLKYVRNRTQGTNKWHEKESEVSLRYKQFLDAKKRSENAVNESREDVLMAGEKFFENQEKEKARLLNESRVERLKQYVDETTGLDFSAMSDEDFDDYLLGKKTRFETAKKEAEAEILRVAEELRIEQERQKAIEIENAKLKAEAEAKEKALKKERAEALAKQKAVQDEADKKALELQAKQEAILKAEQEAKAKLEAELQAKKDAELKEENERLAKEKDEKLEADKLAKAPVKKQLSVWVNGFELPKTEVDNELSKEIKDKFEAFKKWSLTQINNL